MQHKRVILVLGVAAVAACAGDATGPEKIGPGANASIVPTQNQLANWFEHASPAALAVAGSVFADNDEANGRLVFGVENQGVARGVSAVLSRLGIPTSSYSIVVTEPIHQLATLRDVFRPTQAGIQINFGNWVCSLGFNATVNGQESLVTASHCTDRQGGVEGTQYYQPSKSVNGTVIAVETVDPVYFKGGECPQGRKCRYADAAAARYINGTQSSLGVIAKTTGENNGSLTVNGTFTVGSVGDVTSGKVDKVGRTTGWTSGNISGSCINTNVSGSNITQLCQTFVSAAPRTGPIVQGGDSGSGVFQGSSNVQLVGLLWGGNGSGSQFVYSPISQVISDLGGNVVAK